MAVVAPVAVVAMVPVVMMAIFFYNDHLAGISPAIVIMPVPFNHNDIPPSSMVMTISAIRRRRYTKGDEPD
ncbi:MAG: hypothetical protein EOP84_18630 [Verrucomicrobiaceae bacterium]|nr:MAG: hypothetical protein EOP84_18630 [Verrucomicrobiaceae bacterium]